MEEQNQEKVTATQHVKAADAAAPETGNGKKEDKGGGKKEKKTAKPLTPKQLQQRKKLMVYPLMGLLFLGSMWLIFAPSEEREVNRDTVGAFNADIPLPENDGIIGDKRKAYEQAQAERRQAEKVRSLEDFAFSEESDADGVEMELPDSEPEREPFRDYSGNGGGRSSVAAYRDINRKLGSFYEEPKVDGEKEELKRQVEELTAKLEERERQAGGIDDQVALMEKSYELAAKYMGQNGQDGATVQTPATVQNGNGLGQPAVAVQAARERTVSGLQQPLSDAEFMRRYSQPRNYGFNTAVGSSYRMGMNTIPACISESQTLEQGGRVKLRLLEPLQAGSVTILANSLVTGTADIRGERLDILVSSIEYAGNIIPVELATYDIDGQRGIFVPGSESRTAAKEVLGDVSQSMGGSISFAGSAGQQVAMDLTRGVLQGGTRFISQRVKAVKVKLKAGYKVLLVTKKQ